MEARFEGICPGALGALGALGEAAETERMLGVLDAVIAPALTYRVLGRKDAFLSREILLGADIEAALGESRRVIVFAVTLGAGVDRQLARLAHASLADAVLLDRLASLSVETICDNFCRDAAAVYGPLTDRFSPGYGDMPLTVQRAISTLLDLPRTLGVTLTESCLMLPQKSVTAIVGIADGPVTHRGRCADCQYKKEGTCRECL